MKTLRIGELQTLAEIKSFRSAIVTSLIIGLNVAVAVPVQARDDCSLLHEDFETALYEYGDLEEAQLILDELFRQRCPGRQQAHEYYKAAWNQHMDDLRRERDEQIAENERLKRELDALRSPPRPVERPPVRTPPVGWGAYPPGDRPYRGSQRQPSRPCQDSVRSVELLAVCPQGEGLDNESFDNFVVPGR